MRASVIRDFGGPEVFELRDIPTPEVKPGHVLVRIAASSVNTVDTMIRQMGRDLPISPEPPAVLGMDFAGTVEAIASDVTGFAVGDEIYGCAGGLLDSLREVEAIGVNHVAFNLRFNRMDVDQTLSCLAGEVLPAYPSHMEHATQS